MLVSLLLVLLLGQAPAPPVPSAAEAIQLADAGMNREALLAFQARAAVNPNDHEARLWIAVLHERMGNDSLAEAVFRSVLLEDPGSVPALTGVGRTLLARDEPAEALEVLERAEELAPQNDAVLEAIGRAHQRAGRDRDALIYLERAYAVAPTQAHLFRLEDARRSFQHRFESQGFNEHFNGATPASSGGDVMVNYRLRDRLRVSGIGQVVRKFRASDARGGGGVEWAWKATTTLFGQVLIGPDNTVLPQGDYLGGLVYHAPQSDWTLSYRYFDFAGGWTAVVTPSVTWPWSDRLNLTLGYAYALSESTVLDREVSHNPFVRGAYRYRPRVWITAGFAGGVEEWERFTVDRVGDFRANTISIGARVDLESLTSVWGGYERQWRDGGGTMGRVTVAFAQRF
jgi:tetratricopeptide (TPR) repeat protein